MPEKKPKNWEELVNDGDNYGGLGDKLSPEQKIIFEAIKDKTILKIQDTYTFVKHGQVPDDHGLRIATLIAGFEPLKTLKTLIITHNRLGSEGVRILSQSKTLPKLEYLHLGSNDLGDEGAKIIAESPLFSEIRTLNLECNGITAAGACALAQSPYLTRVTSLNLVDNRVGDEGALAFANSDTFSNLTYLHLGGNRIKSEETRQALRHSSKLTRLETIKVF
ncbi:MAG: hypothetical protein COV67_09730 [Nitrospinae bacterium CG11_big_fil_rev_8_21_14_0_20_56_8]|nr:MAG: hypothetical protein COV67_09730 [Nitrospinae bacterium CG11_big_fil_rev_8_21_14_0_20_56_8]